MLAAEISQLQQKRLLCKRSIVKFLTIYYNFVKFLYKLDINFFEAIE